MVSNGDRYKPMQVFPEDYEKFRAICKDLGINNPNGFKLALEVWQSVL